MGAERRRLGGELFPGGGAGHSCGEKEKIDEGESDIAYRLLRGRISVHKKGRTKAMRLDGRSS